MSGTGCLYAALFCGAAAVLAGGLGWRVFEYARMPRR